MEQNTPFDPSRYLITVNGNQYLEVKWRLVWLRTAHPDAVLETELVDHAEHRAIFKASVVLPDGARATGFGSEARDNFPEYIEAAETKAIGRALAAVGFGSQFSKDFELAQHGILADAPVRPVGDRVVQSTYPARAPQQSQGDQAATVNIEQPMSTRQYGLIQVLARELSMSSDDINELAHVIGGADLAGLSRRDASNLIEELQSRTGKSAKAS